MKCHLCKTEKQQTNHWFLVASIVNRGVVILDYVDDSEKGWAESTQVYIVCGESCVLKIVSGLLGEKNVSRLKEQLRRGTSLERGTEKMGAEETKYSDS
jgi:hypothetical protein